MALNLICIGESDPSQAQALLGMLGRRKTKPLKGASTRERVTNLILTKLKGYSTQNIKIMSPISPILQQFDLAEPQRIPKSNDEAEEGLKQKGKSWGKKRNHGDNKSFMFQSITRKKKPLSHKHMLVSWPISVPTISPIFHHRLADACQTAVLMEYLCTIIMTVRSDGCTRRHMSVLCSSNIKL